MGISRYFFSYIFSLIIGFSGELQGQVQDNIQLSASFSSSIQLRIDENPNVSWAIETIGKYEKGYWPKERPIAFSVSSSLNFKVDFVNSPLVFEASTAQKVVRREVLRQ